MNPAGKSILECPACGRSLLNIGQRVERVHPLARLLERYCLPITLLWGLCAFSLLTLLAVLGVVASDRFTLGMMGMTLILVPIWLLHGLVRAFPIHRITDCPFCGHHEERKLGHAPDA